MEKILKFKSGGLMGDFINSLYVVKNICINQEAKADLYINNGGEAFRYGIDKAYNDLYDIVMLQPYINTFSIDNNINNNDSISLYDWRSQVQHDFNNGGYNKSWSELLSNYYCFDVPNEYKWVYILDTDVNYSNATIIHMSNRRRNPKFDTENYILNNGIDNVVFLITNENDLYIDGYDKVVVDDIYKMALILNSCKYFIGNQSMPLALASSLDVPRLAVLDLDFNNYMFYKGEPNYSKNIDVFI